MTQSEILKVLITESGLNQKQFAQKYDVSHVFLNGVLNNKKEYSHWTLRNLVFECGYDLKLTYELK